jgi:hypothetical protein
MNDQKIPDWVLKDAEHGKLPTLREIHSGPWQTGNPPGPGWYLVTVDNSINVPTGTLSRGVGVCFFEPETNRWLMADGETLEQRPILAWQPLPAPYRGPSHES